MILTTLRELAHGTLLLCSAYLSCAVILTGKVLIFIKRLYCFCLGKCSENSWDYKLRENNTRSFITLFRWGRTCGLTVALSVSVWLFSTIGSCVALVVLLQYFRAEVPNGRNTQRQSGHLRGAISKTSIAKWKIQKNYDHLCTTFENNYFIVSKITHHSQVRKLITV